MDVDLKRTLLNGIRWVHRRLLRKPLPNRVAFYFHSLEDGSVESFLDLVTWLSSRGYRFCSLREYLQEVDDKRAFISFDDNYFSWYQQLPLFAEYGVTCTFYTNTFPIRDRSTREDQRIYFDRVAHGGQRVPISTDEIRAIAAAGHTVASHAHTHRKLTDLSLEEGKRELLESKEILEGIVGKPVDDFSYPYGMPRYFPPELRAYAEAIGFRTVANAMPCMLHAKVRPTSVERHAWRSQVRTHENIRDAEIDGRIFVKLFGRSPIG
jgi:peptidoglycan/xylan/chitin deacetylase (PgdA/CDA1 family)